MSTQNQPCSPATAPMSTFSRTSTKLRISSPLLPSSTASPSDVSPSETTTEVEVVTTVVTSRLSSDAISDSQSVAQMEDMFMGLGIAAVTASRLASHVDGLPCTPLKASGPPTPLGGFFSQAAGTPHGHGRSRPSAGIRAMHSPLADQVPIPNPPLAARSYSPVARHGGMNSPAGIRGNPSQFCTASRSQRVNSPRASASPYTDASYLPLISADRPASRNGMSPRCPHTPRTPSSVSPSVSYPSSHRHGHEDYGCSHRNTNANDEAYASADYEPSPRAHDHSMAGIDLGEIDAFGDEADEDDHAGWISCSRGGEYYAKVYENVHCHPYVEYRQEAVQYDNEHQDACTYTRGERARRPRPCAQTMDCCTHAPLGQGHHPRIEDQKTVPFRHVATCCPSVHSHHRPRPIEHPSSMGRKAGSSRCTRQTQTIGRGEDGAESPRERRRRCGAEMEMASQCVIDASGGMKEALGDEGQGEHRPHVGRMNAGTQTDATNGNALASSAAQEGGHDVVSIGTSHPSSTSTSSEASGTSVGLQTSEPVRLDVDATYSSTSTNIMLAATVILHFRSAHNTWFPALQIPCGDIQRFSHHPLKWLRFISFTVCGAHGVLSTRNDCVTDNDLEDTNIVGDYYYVTTEQHHFVDFSALDDRITFNATIPRRSGFRDDIITRDGSCIITQDDIALCDAAHVIPRSKGDEYITFVINDRRHLYQEQQFPPEAITEFSINIIENGLLLRADLHRLFGHGGIVFLRTPNFAMQCEDVHRVETSPMPDMRITMQYIEPQTGRLPLPQYDIQMTGTREPTPPSLLLDFMYAAAVVKKWSTAELHEELKKRFEDYMNIPPLIREESPFSDDTESSPDDSDSDFKPESSGSEMSDEIL